jgi:hypothetical protein
MIRKIPVFLTTLTLASTGSLAFAQSCGPWEVIPSPNPPGAENAIIRDITTVTADDAWAVGDWWGFVNGIVQNYAFTMHWDGAAWSLISTPQPAPCDDCHNLALYGVDAIGPNDVWAAGGQVKQAPDGFVGTHILVMHWDGSEWTVMETPVQVGASGDLIWRVQALAPDDVWFFGENLYSPQLLLGLAIALHWDGSRFEFIDVPVVNFQGTGPTSDNSLHAGSALSPDDIWAVGAGGDGDPIVCELSQIHHWDGQTWTHVPSQAPDGCAWHSLYAVEAIASDDVWAGGESFDGDYRGLSLHWNGSAWSEEPTPIGIADFVSFATDDVYAFGGGVAHWDGSAWTLAESFPDVDGPSLTGADAAGVCNVWAGGRQLVGDKLTTLTVRMAPDDADSDGVPDGADNCTAVPNPDQRDTNGDGYGNVCDPDLDNDGLVNFADLGMMKNVFFSADADADLDGNGSVNFSDVGILKAFFFRPPGPSGLAQERKSRQGGS